MTNKELIINLLNSDLDAEVDLRKTIGNMEFKPIQISKWLRDGQHAVICANCHCRVSIKAYPSMDYCFRCGSKMEG